MAVHALNKVEDKPKDVVYYDYLDIDEIEECGNGGIVYVVLKEISMTIQEKIQRKAEEFGKLAPVFLEGAKFALENRWK